MPGIWAITSPHTQKKADQNDEKHRRRDRDCTHIEGSFGMRWRRRLPRCRHRGATHTGRLIDARGAPLKSVLGRFRSAHRRRADQHRTRRVGRAAACHFGCLSTTHATRPTTTVGECAPERAGRVGDAVRTQQSITRSTDLRVGPPSRFKPGASRPQDGSISTPSWNSGSPASERFTWTSKARLTSGRSGS